MVVYANDIEAKEKWRIIIILFLETAPIPLPY